jgi:hypothetical protein
MTRTARTSRRKPQTPDIPDDYAKYPAVPPTPTPDRGATAMTVSLRSRESANTLLRQLRDADSHAKDAHQKGEAAFADAVRLEQVLEGLKQREAELRGELDQLQLNREEARQRAEDARAYGTRQHAERDDFADQAADARTFLDLAGISVDPNLLVPTSAPNGNGPAPVTPGIELDPTEKARMDKSFANMDAARAELPADQREEDGPL